VKPTTKQLINSISWSLDNKVAPMTEDKWAASTLRSVRCLLTHLATRADLEGQLLFDDNIDLRDTLRRVETVLAPVSPALGAAISDVLRKEWRSPDEYPTVVSLTAENDAMRSVADVVLVALRAGDVVDEHIRTEARGEVESWVRRRLVRDQPLFLPAFMANNF